MFTIFYQEGPDALTDEEVLQLVRSRNIPAYKLEAALGKPERGVSVRRQLITPDIAHIKALDGLPYQ
mgnify:FL=1